MSLNLPYGIKPVIPLSNLDKDRYGPWSTLEEALLATQGTRERGLTVGIIENNNIVEYWFSEGIEDVNLVKKTAELNLEPGTGINITDNILNLGTLSSEYEPQGWTWKIGNEDKFSQVDLSDSIINNALVFKYDTSKSLYTGFSAINRYSELRTDLYNRLDQSLNSSVTINTEGEILVSDTVSGGLNLSSKYLDGVIKEYQTSFKLSLGEDRSHGLSISSNYPLFKGLEYISDFSNNFSDKSLVNKKWVDDKLLEKEQVDNNLQDQIINIIENSPIDEIRFLTSETIVLNGNTFYQSKKEKGTNPVFNITRLVGSNTTPLTANVVASFVGIALTEQLQLIEQNTSLLIRANKARTSNDIYLFAKFYDYTSSGVRTLKGTSTEVLLTAVSTNYTLLFPIEEYVAEIGSRGLIEILSYQVGSDASADAVISIESDYYSRWSYVLPTGSLSFLDEKVISSQDLPNINSPSGETQKQINAKFDSALITAPKSIPFNVNIPFTSVMTSMPLTTSNIERVFVPVTTSAVAGARCVVVMTANGNILHTPGFDPLFSQSPDSMIWDNTSNVKNTIEFWFDGTTYWYKITRLSSNIAYKSDVIVKGTGTPYIPVNDYDPTNKVYVDTTIKNYLANYYPGSPVPPEDEGLGWYGVEWDEGRVNTGCLRIGSLSSYIGGGAYAQAGYPIFTRPFSNIPNNLLFVHNKMKRCLVFDNATRNYYLDANNSYNREGVEPSVFGTSETASRTSVTSTGTFTAIAGDLIGRYIHNTTNGKTMIYCKITGKTNDNTVTISDPRNGQTTNLFEIGDTFEVCTARLDGVDGQVMVEIPRIYYFQNYLPSDTGNPDYYKIRCGVALYPYAGFTLHPAFIDNGQEKEFLYVGAFEGYTLSGKGSSLPDYVSTVNKTRVAFRAEASARGIDWSQVTMYQHWLLQMLFYIEYADLNSQYRIPDTTIPYNNRIKTGRSLANGNNSVSMRINSVLDANLTTANFETDIVGMSYRGIENFYGNIWKFVDGINLFDRRLYLCNDRISLADDTMMNYTDTGCYLPVSDSSYYNRLFPISGGFVPRKTGGASSQNYADGVWTNTGWTIGLLGGTSTHVSLSGVGCLRLNYGSAYAWAYIGARFACSK